MGLARQVGRVWTRFRRWLNVTRDPAPAAPCQVTRSAREIENALYLARCRVEQLEEPFLRALVGPTVAAIGVFFGIVSLIVKPAVEQDLGNVAVWIPTMGLVLVLGALAIGIIRAAARRDRDLSAAQNEVRYLTLELERAEKVSAGSPAPIRAWVPFPFQRR